MSGLTSVGSLTNHGPLIVRLHQEARASRWGLSVERFGEALARSSERRFRPATLDSVPPREIAAYLESLHATDLALACACAEGSESAWDEFMKAFRPDLYAAARAIAGDAAAARELADSLYADLYGVAERDGRRRPLFEYFHGRSKLSTWLRAVLAQRYVDQLRATRRTRSLDEKDESAPTGSPATRLITVDSPSDPDRPRLARLFEQAVAQAVAALVPADRLRLSYSYLHGLTLAEIGRLMAEHESSASRKLERTRRALRVDIERRLREHGLRDDDIRECYERATEEGVWDLTELLNT